MLIPHSHLLQVVDPSNLPQDVLKERPTNKKANFYCVRFFPKGDQCVVGLPLIASVRPLLNSAWLVSKDMSRLQTHEIQAYVNEPFKKSGELLEGYRIALDPTKWEAKVEAERAEAAEEEENAEVDQLEEPDADGDDDDDEKPKTKKRKRESDAKVRSKAKKGSSEPASKKKATVKGRKNGAKSKDTVESEDEGTGDAGPSKQQGTPPAAKKPKRDKDDGRTCCSHILRFLCVTCDLSSSSC